MLGDNPVIALKRVCTDGQNGESHAGKWRVVTHSKLICNLKDGK